MLRIAPQTSSQFRRQSALQDHLLHLVELCVHHVRAAVEVANEGADRGDEVAKDESAKEQRRNPEEAAGWLAYVLMWYANPTLRLGAARRLEERDVLPLAALDEPALIRDVFESHWRELGASATLRAVLWRQFRRRLLYGFVGSIFFVLLTIAAPLTIRALVAHVARGRSRNYAKGVGLVAVLTGIQLLDAVVRAHTMYHPV